MRDILGYNLTTMMDNLKIIACIGCGALVPDMDGPAARYKDAGSPGCWAVYEELLAKEYQDFAYSQVHRLTVDCYAVQHPGSPTAQSAQSVHVHLASIYLELIRGFPPMKIAPVMQRIIKMNRGSFPWLAPPHDLGQITVLDIARAKDAGEHRALVKKWAASLWAAWGEHQAAVIPLVEAALDI